jgi:hypothetical protein
MQADECHVMLQHVDVNVVAMGSQPSDSVVSFVLVCSSFCHRAVFDLVRSPDGIVSSRRKKKRLESSLSWITFIIQDDGW